MGKTDFSATIDQRLVIPNECEESAKTVAALPPTSLKSLVCQHDTVIIRGVKTYYVYILTSKAGVLYTGITNDIKTRVFQHKTKLNESFTQKYDVNLLMYFETFSEPCAAIAREKQIKAYRREKKVALIDSINPDWADLSEGWYDQT